MNWRYLIGGGAERALHRILSHRRFPLISSLPYNLSVLYDIQRFLGSKKLETLFDVGANVGQTAGMLSRYFPDSTIYSFEPVSSSYRELVDHCKALPNVRPVQTALGDTPGSAEIQMFACSECNTLVPNARAAMVPQGTETIVVNTVDRFIEQQQIQAIDLLKIDVQGWELRVLQGAAKALSESRIRFIYSEVCFSRDDPDMQQFSQLHEFLEQHTFRFCGLYEQFRYGRHKEFVGFGNALYLSETFSSSRPTE